MESEDNATFAAFDSGISEYESAKSSIVESSCNEGEEEADFFDSFVEAETKEVIDEPNTTTDDNERVKDKGDTAEKKEDFIPPPEDVDLLLEVSTKICSEKLTPTTTMQQPTQIDDPFDAFNDIRSTPLQEETQLVDMIQQSSNDIPSVSQQQEDTTTITDNNEIFFEVTNNSQPTTIESTNNNNNMIENINNMQLDNLETDDELFSNFNNDGMLVVDATKLSADEIEKEGNNEKDEDKEDKKKQENTITIFDHKTGKECEIPVSSLNNATAKEATEDIVVKIKPEDTLHPSSNTGESNIDDTISSPADLKAGEEERITSTVDGEELVNVDDTEKVAYEQNEIKISLNGNNEQQLDIIKDNNNISNSTCTADGGGEEEVNDNNTYSEDISTAIFDSMAAQMAIDMNGFVSTVANFNNNGESRTDCEDIDEEEDEEILDDKVDNNNICSVCPTNMKTTDEHGEINNVGNVEAEVLPPTSELENSSPPISNEDTILSEDLGDFTTEDVPQMGELDQNGIEEVINGDVFGGFTDSLPPPEMGLGPVITEPISDLPSSQDDYGGFSAFESGPPANQLSEEEAVAHEPSTKDEAGDSSDTPVSGESREDDAKHTAPNILDGNTQIKTSDDMNSDGMLEQNNGSDKVVAFSSVSFNADDHEIKDMPNSNNDTDQLKVSFTSKKAMDASVSFEIQALESEEQATPDHVVAFSSVSVVAEQPEEIKVKSDAVTDQIEKVPIQDEVTADTHDEVNTMKQEEVSTSQLGVEQSLPEPQSDDVDCFGDFTAPKTPIVEEVEQPTQPSHGETNDEFGNFEEVTETPAIKVDADVVSQPSHAVNSAEIDDTGDKEKEEVSTGLHDEQIIEQQAVKEDDCFGDFEATAETPVVEDIEPPAELPIQPTDTAIPAEDEPDNSFGNFNAFEDAPPEAPQNDNVENNDQPQLDVPVSTEVEEVTVVSQPMEVPQHDDELNNDQPPVDDKPVSTEEGHSMPIEDDEFGDFDGTSFQDTPIESSSPVIVSKEENKGDSDIDESSPAMAEDEFGNFEDFNATTPEETPLESSLPEQTPTVEGTKDEEAAVASQSLEAPKLPGDEDDGFGDFGDANFDEAPTNTLPESTPTIEENIDQPPTEAAQVDDEFGDFGDFNAFEEAPTTESSTNVEVSEQPSSDKGEVTKVEPQEDDDDDWGEFDAFEEEAPATEETPPQEVEAPAESTKTSATPVESTAAPEAVSVLNESVRSMFQNVFVVSETASPQNKGTCSDLPFSVPMSKILPEEIPVTKEDDIASRVHPSDQELAKMKEYFANQPRSAPLAILSDDKWYPYSQYEFNKDGSPYADSVERVTTPVVPEVMDINLPTGFDISESTKQKAAPPPPDSSGFRSTPTVVDFPSTPPPDTKKSINIREEKANEEDDDIDLSKLSAKGRQFMEQLPDLSYMLKSTLCLPERK